MPRKILIAINLVLFGVAAAQAGPIRPLYTKDVNQPEYHGLEVGSSFSLVEIEDLDETFDTGNTNIFTTTPYARFRIAEPLTLFAAVPFVSAESDSGKDKNGAGDFSFGFELVTYKDIFDYPWIMPHVNVTLDTAGRGLGQGESSVELGLALGTKTWDSVDWIGDFRYEVFEDRDNVGSMAVSIIWNLSEEFSFLFEGKLADEEEAEDEKPIFFAAGMSYSVSEDLVLTVNMATAKNSRQDVLANLQVSYNLW